MKTEAKVILVLVLAFAMIEVAVRLGESRLSADVRQMLAFEEMPQRMAEEQAKGRTCVLVLGNSLARAAVDRETLEAGLEEKGYAEPRVFHLTPDATGVNEWTAAYRKYFPAGSGVVRPDFLILVTGPSHLLDHPVRHPEKLSAYLTARRDRSTILLEWLKGGSERCRFLLAGGSKIFANRERLRPLLFYNWVPGYEATAQRLNRSGGKPREESGSEEGSAARFQTLLDSLGLPPDRVLLVASPLPESYGLPGAVREAASRRGIAVYEEAASAAWPPEAFPDGYHLGGKPAENFTRRLGERIQENQSFPGI